jgi:signal transduction histidine kinase
VELEEELLQLEDVVRSSLQTIEPLAEKKSIELICDPLPEGIQIRVDRTRFKQILLNLLGNAVKFTEAGGQVGIRAFPDEHRDDLVIAIRDTGIGIAAQDLTKVLEPFELIESTLTRSKTGTGLGLPIARALTAMHGGELNLTSQLGVGTTVELRLPSHRVRVLEPALSQAEAPPGFLNLVDGRTGADHHEFSR